MERPDDINIQFRYIKLPRACQSALRGTESHSFSKSTKRRNFLASCSFAFSSSWIMMKIMSVQLPLCGIRIGFQGASTLPAFVAFPVLTLATTLPTTSSRAIPLQLLQSMKFPFLGIAFMENVMMASRTDWMAVDQMSKLPASDWNILLVLVVP